MVVTSAYHCVAVTVLDADRAVLLSLASVIHRRGFEVVAANLTAPAGGLREFVVLVAAAEGPARALAQFLRNRVDVLSVELEDGAGPWHHDPAPADEIRGGGRGGWIRENPPGGPPVGAVTARQERDRQYAQCRRSLNAP